MNIIIANAELKGLPDCLAQNQNLAQAQNKTTNR